MLYSVSFKNSEHTKVTLLLFLSLVVLSLSLFQRSPRSSLALHALIAPRSSVSRSSLLSPPLSLLLSLSLPTEALDKMQVSVPGLSHPPSFSSLVREAPQNYEPVLALAHVLDSATAPCVGVLA